MQSGAIYARISKVLDPEDTLGVQRQIMDCRRGASRRGDQISAVYTDNDVSASTGKPRPAYERMLQAIRDGKHDGVWVWDLDRLHRRPTELEEFIALADEHRLELASVGGEVDIATPQGRLTARIKGAVARAEAEMMSRRIRRKHQELAEAGKPHGGTRPYGYAKGGERLIPEEASIVRELAARVLCGDTLLSLERDLNARGVPTVDPAG
jgi:DNA invertase Pin-like site-specific DNA recombinase